MDPRVEERLEAEDKQAGIYYAIHRGPLKNAELFSSLLWSGEIVEGH